MGAYKQRLLGLFDSMDSDRNGVLVWDDFQRVIDRQDASAPQAKAYEDFIRAYWNIVDPSDRGRDGNYDGTISKEEFLVYAEKKRIGTTPETSDLGPMANAAFTFMDTAGTGAISKTQFQDYLTARNVRAEYAEEAFRRLSTNKETITAKDVLTGLHTFFTSPDPTPEHSVWVDTLFPAQS
ncbi:hypothetical protein AB0B30_04120 [Streptomyces narbonensis]|uniref:Calcium-binding protein n=1 Tax=Streptomyces narbonensis TaxID=67333 RepID=A0ABV3C5J5_9ACTN